MLCGSCDRCISMATGMDVKPKFLFGLQKFMTDCRLRNNEILLTGLGDWGQPKTRRCFFCDVEMTGYSPGLKVCYTCSGESMPVIRSTNTYKNGIAAEREACAQIAAMNVDPYQFRNEYAQLDGQKYGNQPFHVPPFSEWVIGRIATYKAGLIRARSK